MFISEMCRQGVSKARLTGHRCAIRSWYISSKSGAALRNKGSSRSRLVSKNSAAQDSQSLRHIIHAILFLSVPNRSCGAVQHSVSYAC
jgi:hypothetical protein